MEVAKVKKVSEKIYYMMGINSIKNFWKCYF